MVRSNRQTPQRLLGALRQLALTAPGGRMAAAEAVGLLHAVAGIEISTLVWVDAHCLPLDKIDTFATPASLWQDYVENFHDTPLLDAVLGSTHASLQANGERVRRLSQHRDHRAYVRSVFFNRIGRAIGAEWTAALPMRHGDGTPLACLLASRSFDSPDFNAAETRLLQQAQPWLEHLLRKGDPPALNGTALIVRDSASMLIERDGRLASASPGAMQLLHQAADIPFSGTSLAQAADGDVRMLLRRFAATVEAGVQGMPVLPPARSISNRWGNFHLRAYALNDGRGPQAVLHIERQVPVWLALFRAKRFLAMSTRQREVCLHLLAGLTHAEMARIMEVKVSSVIYFVRQIYLRLNITRRSELIGALTLEG
jgi:DNA-binding CsgD family transcriptional regulator